MEPGCIPVLGSLKDDNPVLGPLAGLVLYKQSLYKAVYGASGSNILVYLGSSRKEVLQMMNLKGIIVATTVAVTWLNMVIYWAWFMK